ncbi:hypothetical protein GKE82_26065 [Conexibacter sp. W3-3-2]|uniref:hypothetical protein n=1 Tax=Conexibacter sp. W3-3-2 TaxID=2675227 RepID=UPI0012B7CBAE|nr:hypothetical protein [Conexibacter sp. W3-3-2]MTD47671.1 hypothetical protein [Conexibacter sp. W3-3-2]
MHEFVAFAETGCLRDLSTATDHDSTSDELPVAPAAAVAEWLRREPCAVCGQRGCVVVERVSVSRLNEATDDAEEIDEYTPPVCPYCGGTGTDEKSGVLRIPASGPPGAQLVNPQAGLPADVEALRAELGREPCTVCDGAGGPMSLWG